MACYLVLAAVVCSVSAAQHSTFPGPSTDLPVAPTIPSIIPTAKPVAPRAPSAILLVSKHFEYPSGIPYQVDTDAGTRGFQFGYNICNSTTEGSTSLCQTAMVNSIDDFCLWAPSKPNSVLLDVAGETIVWCTKPGRGTRLIPAGALTGIQFMKTPDYLQVVGFIDQTNVNLVASDFGGQLDPHGADSRGNPIGGIAYSNGFPSNNGNHGTFQQVVEWNRYSRTFHRFILSLMCASGFMGGNAFCFKVCDPAGPNAARFCERIYDRIGCAYNAPNAAQDRQFVSCQGDNQDFPGVFTIDGVVMTYTQPPISLGPITTIPYVARIPASSNCVSFQSQLLFTGTAMTGATATRTNVPTSTSNNTDNKHKVPIGPAVGGALGGLALIIVILFAFFYLRRGAGDRRQDSREIDPKPTAAVSALASEHNDIAYLSPTILNLPTSSPPNLQTAPIRPSMTAPIPPSKPIDMQLPMEDAARPAISVDGRSSNNPSHHQESQLLMRLYNLNIPAEDIALVVNAMRGRDVSSVQESQLLPRLYDLHVPAEDIALIVSAMRGHGRSSSRRQPNDPPQPEDVPPEYDFKER